MTNLLICGINGKMGQAVYSAATTRTDVTVACGVDKHVLGNFNCPVFNSMAQVCVHVDVIIDFSSPSALSDILEFATERQCAVVLATTGYTDAQIAEIENASQKIPIVATCNTSKGMNAIISALPIIRASFDEADIFITDKHKKSKADSPSGTAKMISEALGGNAEILSMRGGDLPGEHEIIMLGDGEKIVITHTVLTREVFAKNAVDIAVKLSEKK